MAHYTALNMKYVDIPALTLDADSTLSYSGNTQVATNTINIPGVMPESYTHIQVFGATYKIANIIPNWVIIYNQFPTTGTSVHVDASLGYAQNDGRKISNWSCPGLTISSIIPGRITFDENFTVGRFYTLTLLNPVKRDAVLIWPRGTEFCFSCTENYDPTTIDDTVASDGLVTITFSNPIAEDEGYIYGLDYDRIEYDEDKLLIYTSEAGDVSFELQGFFDMYGNPIEDQEVSVTLEAITDTLKYLDEGYSIRRKSRLDYEDTVLSEAYSWLKTQDLN